VKLGLGAVQFGLAYGVSNSAGRTPRHEVGKILALAASIGIGVVDTAAGYGDSEAALGQAGVGGTRLRVVTKTPAFGAAPVTLDDADQLERALHASLARLQVDSVYGLLVHRADDLAGPGGELLMARMAALKAAGLVEKIGVSVYHAGQIDALLAHHDIDLIQLPFSLLDQRLLHSGHLAALKLRGVEIHARSIFLQGLLLMAPDALPPFFAPLRGHLQACHERCEALGASPLEAALAWTDSVDEIDIALCGVNDSAQLRQISAAAGKAVALGDGAGFAVREEAFLNPANWERA
jgi:aryl-alcohol dehydrogenase-like predicted oxidoreductase